VNRAFGVARLIEHLSEILVERNVTGKLRYRGAKCADRFLNAALRAQLDRRPVCACWTIERHRGMGSHALSKTPLSSMPNIPFPNKKVTRAVALAELAILEKAYPSAVTALTFTNPYELLIAVILSAQCTDARVNMTTPALFAKYPTAAKLAAAEQTDVEAMIKSCGFYRMKAKNIIAAATSLVSNHGGEVPRTREELEALAGVGRKTASVVMSVAFEEAAFAVDTHVFRVAHRLGLTLGTTPRQVEEDVTKLVPREKWRHAHHWLILHGRAICKAPTPLCAQCPVNQVCPSAKVVLKRQGAKAAATRRPARAVSKAKKR
jgi:endonuclease-3